MQSGPLSFFQYQKGTLHCEGVALQKIAQEVGTPAYIYSSKAIVSAFSAFKTGLSELDSLVCFAVKSNSNLSILNLLAEQGAGMDIVSGGELFRAQKAGVQPERIVFSGVGKTRDELKAALLLNERGIFSFNVESIPELMALNEVATQCQRKARVSLRFNPDVNAKTHPYISTGLKKNKFGLDRTEILEVVKRHKTLKGIEFKGISIHIGSQLLSLAPLEDAYRRLQALVTELEGTLPAPLEFLDLGGGLGVPYLKEKAPAIEGYCALIRKLFKKPFSKGPLKILIEPGRSIVANAGVLVTQVVYRKEKRSKDFLIVDAGMNDLIRPALYQSVHQIVPLREPKGSGKKTQVSVVGPVCESSDCFLDGQLVHKSLSAGDGLAILSAGAYGFSMASNYNSRPRPVEVLVKGNRYEIIRKRESYADLIIGETNF